MAFTTLKTRTEAISLQRLGDDIAERQAALGPIAVPRNTGKRRTPSKQALLDEIARLGGDW
jgi:hypothetical protein